MQHEISTPSGENLIVETGRSGIQISKQVEHLEVHYRPGHDEEKLQKLVGKDVIIYDEHHGTTVRIQKATAAVIEHYMDEYSTVMIL